MPLSSYYVDEEAPMQLTVNLLNGYGSKSSSLDHMVTINVETLGFQRGSQGPNSSIVVGPCFDCGLDHWIIDFSRRESSATTRTPIWS